MLTDQERQRIDEAKAARRQAPTDGLYWISSCITAGCAIAGLLAILFAAYVVYLEKVVRPR